MAVEPPLTDEMWGPETPDDELAACLSDVSDVDLAAMIMRLDDVTLGEAARRVEHSREHQAARVMRSEVSR